MLSVQGRLIIIDCSVFANVQIGVGEPIGLHGALCAPYIWATKKWTG